MSNENISYFILSSIIGSAITICLGSVRGIWRLPMRIQLLEKSVDALRDEFKEHKHDTKDEFRSLRNEMNCNLKEIKNTLNSMQLQITNIAIATTYRHPEDAKEE